MAVVLVRHAEPQVDPSVDPRQWTLSEAGRGAARDLRARLPFSTVWVSSTEVKAHETLLLAGGPGVVVAQDSGFNEVHRIEPFDDAYRARRLAWVEGRLDERHSGWETPHAAAERFDRAIGAFAIEGRPVVVASHGMVLTAWLVHARHLIAPGQAGQFWSALTMPDVIEVD